MPQLFAAVRRKSLPLARVVDRVFIRHGAAALGSPAVVHRTPEVLVVDLVHARVEAFGEFQ